MRLWHPGPPPLHPVMEGGRNLPTGRGEESSSGGPRCRAVESHSSVCHTNPLPSPLTPNKAPNPQGRKQHSGTAGHHTPCAIENNKSPLSFLAARCTHLRQKQWSPIEHRIGACGCHSRPSGSPAKPKRRDASPVLNGTRARGNLDGSKNARPSAVLRAEGFFEDERVGGTRAGTGVRRSEIENAHLPDWSSVSCYGAMGRSPQAQEERARAMLGEV